MEMKSELLREQNKYGLGLTGTEILDEGEEIYSSFQKTLWNS